jgi:chaperonin GroES
MFFRPMGDRVLVDQDAVETYTSAGFYIPETSAEQVNRGTIVAVGPGKVSKTGVAVPIDDNLKVNERILFAPGSGLKVTVSGVDYLVLKEEEVIAIVEE